MRAVLLLALAVAAALAAAPAPPTPAPNPSQPVWPSQFSASVMFQDDTTGVQRFFRWFYSAVLNKDRFDGPVQWNNEMYFFTQIFDHVADQQYDVFAQVDEVTCFSHALNGTIPKPNLAGLKYVGKAMVGYPIRYAIAAARLVLIPVQEAAYHWIGQQSTPFNVTWQYFDAQDTREPLRIDLAADNQAGTYTFWEFDSGVQDAYLYSLPTTVLAQCNAV